MNVTDQREKTVERWFAMWLRQDDSGIGAVFEEDALYIESWGPQYEGLEKIGKWFREWNTRGRVLRWDIKRYFHSGATTVVEWDFKDEMAGGKVEEFEGMSLIEWSPGNKIAFLKEFGCNKKRYDPYRNGEKPVFPDEEAKWF